MRNCTKGFTLITYISSQKFSNSNTGWLDALLSKCFGNPLSNLHDPYSYHGTHMGLNAIEIS